jgi:protein-L-isoaspartate(D-aspartate) O-methyltransferase
MAEAAEIKPTDKVLEIGAESGYAAAVLAVLARQVFTIERHRTLASGARARLEALEQRNVEVRIGNGALGWPEQARFDAILVAAGAPQVPNALKQRLAIGGRLVIPIGEGRAQELRKIVRPNENEYADGNLAAVHFVPLVGEQGWREESRPPKPTR